MQMDHDSVKGLNLILMMMNLWVLLCSSNRRRPCH